ncbi:fungal-specific transcription factor domain-containing protein [Stachybotrys elegans]|uniref:Fungal-specific transcription factor domain-containing protein n=1 Tax=Stachybotrys elegans TaxID=80388 RepID=A0A8K0WMH5_9HYPO|nr:fungal-specific transcription factor domain-containing protein [Stachybotrys elegans]
MEDRSPSAGGGNTQRSGASTPQPASASHSGTPAAPSQGGPTPSAHSAGPTPQSSNAPSTSSGTTSHAQNSKRRRGLGVVTPNACTECRKKRAKCDGQKPCGRCRNQRDVECVYEIPVRQSKENLRTEIEHLRHRQRSSDQVFAALVRPELWEDVLARLRGGQTIESISDWLGGNPFSRPGTMQTAFSRGTDPNVGTASGMSSLAPFGSSSSASLTTMPLGASILNPMTAPAQQTSFRNNLDQHNRPWQLGDHRTSHPDAMNWTADVHNQPPSSRVGSWAESLHSESISGSTPRFRGLELVLSPLNVPEMKTPSDSWTSITSDINLVQHLLALYFCWEYPTFASLSKEHFLRDFQDGRARYCSPILVNALLALGCRFSSQPMTRAYPNDPYSSGDHFFKECQRLYYQEKDHHSLTTIQALGIMSIREASCGRDSESWYYAGQSIRLAIEMGLHRLHDEGDEDELAVQSATFWGAFALDHAWSLATGSLPQCSCFPYLPPRPAIIDDIEASLWVPYTDDGAPLQRSCEQPSNVRSVYKCFCELSELVHQSLYVLHSPGRPLTARDLLSIYTQYLDWYDRIPEVLRLGHNFTPAVLFAHMYYHFAILLLFRPLLKLRIIGSKVLPRDVCSQAADAIQGLLRSYSQLYTLRRTPSFVPYFVLTSAIMHLAVGASSLQVEGSKASTPKKMETAAKLDPRVKDAISQGIADLTEMAPCHHFAEQALNILRYLARKWNIEVEIDPDQLSGDEYDRLVRPYTGSLNFFAPNVRTEDFVCDWSFGQGMGEPGAKNVYQQASEATENPLFWPFPMQGRPMLPSGKELEQAGFAML